MTPEDMRVLRARLNWSQEQLGAEIGRRFEAISKYERGVQPIPQVVALACAAIEAGIRYTPRAA